MQSIFLLVMLLVLLPRISAGEPGGTASPKEATTQKDGDWIDDRWTRTEIGQFLGATIQTPRRLTPRGIAIQVGENDSGSVCFDTDLLRYSASWLGGFLQLHPQRYGLIAAPSPKGEIQISTAPEPGWASEGSFKDPRSAKFGPLPRNWGRYQGLYLAGKRVALKYTTGSLEVLDSPWLEHAGDSFLFTRTLQIKGTGSALLRICDEPGGLVEVRETAAGSIGAVYPKGEPGKRIEVAAVSDGKIQMVPGEGGALNLHISSPGKMRIKISMAALRGGQQMPFEHSNEIESLDGFTKGGAPRWSPELETAGILGRTNGPLVIDTLTIPYTNPWNALMFTSGHDFFENGDAAVCTIHGDVWLVSGIDERLSSLKWKRFATGLHQPLGLKIVGGKVHVIERDRITILHDLNGDHEADYYENFNNDCISTGGGHSYATCLETDGSGNFYFLKCAEQTPHGGTVLKVSADGSNLEVLATGFRNPNGLGVSANGIITVADQQGEWVPETRLDIIKPGGFYGFTPMHKREMAPANFDPPLCWIPRTVDNSAGGEVWVPPGLWGPMQDQLLHLSYGRCSMMMVLRDERNQRLNGGVVPLPGRYLSGVMRGRFNPHDRALYLSGLRGWQTAAVKDGAFQRVRHTGAPLLAPVSFAVTTHSIELTFDSDLDPELAQDLSSYTVEQWNYRWSERYGSSDFSIREPEKEGRDKLAPVLARLFDKRKIVLEFAELLHPVNVLRIAYNLESKSGDEIRSEFYCTINNLEK